MQWLLNYIPFAYSLEAQHVVEQVFFIAISGFNPALAANCTLSSVDSSARCAVSSEVVII